MGKSFNEKLKTEKGVFIGYYKERKQVILDISSKKGKELYNNAIHFEDYKLSDVYKNWSHEKQMIYDDLFKEFRNNKKANYFRIGNVNSYGFVCSFFEEYGTFNLLNYFTKKTHYIVIL